MLSQSESQGKFQLKPPSEPAMMIFEMGDELNVIIRYGNNFGGYDMEKLWEGVFSFECKLANFSALMTGASQIQKN